MSDFQEDEEQWLYGDDKEDSAARENEEETPAAEKESSQTPVDEEENSEENDKEDEEPAKEQTDAEETNGEEAEPEQNEESHEAEQNGDKSREDADEEDSFSSSDDEPTVTIGKIVKQPDIMRPPPPTHRAAPTSGLKDDDFNSTGKVNGVPAQDYSLAELEDKPWRKPGADLSDYFNYGFSEETWIKYCERQKRMRNNESGVGLTGLGVNIGKGLSSGSIPVSIVNENSKYGGLRKVSGIADGNSNEDGVPVSGPRSAGNTIQVMTADRRTYSNKVMGGGGPNYDDMDFGGNPYGADFFSAPPPGYFNPPPPPAGPWGGIPNIPPPAWTPGIPPPMPPPHNNMGSYFDEDSVGPMGSSHSRSSKDDRERDRERDRDYDKVRDSRDRDSRERESRHHSSRRRSRSRSKSRHHKRSSRTRSRSRSRSPTSHRHKRKKSKRERED